ncbi:MAG: GAF domain-containing protein [Candidatus Omnitrophica bacterium]|nr:GAF domain-containing protein [Candidatus Omnitrophota bacterium]
MPTKKKTSRKLKVSPVEELEILRTIVEITNSDLNLDKALKEVVKVVNDMTKADSVFIYLFNDKRKHLVLMASKTPHKKELGQVTLKAGEGITGWVAKENQPVAISKDASQDKRFKKFDVLPEDQYEAFLSVPIVHKNNAIGVVNVQHKDPHEYDEATIDLIMLIAKQISGTLEHARLYEETRKKAIQFDSLNKVSQSIISQDYLDEILNLIVVVTGEMLNSKICSIMLVDNKGKELSVKATHALTDSFRKRPSVRINSSLSGEAVQKKTPIVAEDVQANSKFQHRDLALKENLSSVCIVPMVVKDQAIGVISVYTKEPHSFSDEEVAVLQIIANQAAVAVENTKLVDEMVRAKEALETRKLVERAKGILMRMNNLSEEAAHRLIHKKAMDSCKTMKDIAESIILMEEFSA